MARGKASSSNQLKKPTVPAREGGWVCAREVGHEHVALGGGWAVGGLHAPVRRLPVRPEHRQPPRHLPRHETARAPVREASPLAAATTSALKKNAFVATAQATALLRWRASSRRAGRCRSGARWRAVAVAAFERKRRRTGCTGPALPPRRAARRKRRQRRAAAQRGLERPARLAT